MAQPSHDGKPTCLRGGVAVRVEPAEGNSRPPRREFVTAPRLPLTSCSHCAHREETGIPYRYQVTRSPTVFRSVRINGDQGKGGSDVGCECRGDAYEPEKPLADRTTTASGSLAVGVRRAGRLHVHRRRCRHHHALGRARLMGHQTERPTEQHRIVLGRVARLSSPLRAMAHRGRAELAGEARTRCAGARGPPGSGCLRRQRRRPPWNLGATVS